MVLTRQSLVLYEPIFLFPQIWSKFEEKPVEEAVAVVEEKERNVNYKSVLVTEITDELHFYVQDVETGKELLLLYKHNLPFYLPALV